MEEITEEGNKHNTELQTIILTVKSWRNTDKYPCPKCGQKLGTPTYTCTPCNIKIQPVLNLNW